MRMTQRQSLLAERQQLLQKLLSSNPLSATNADRTRLDDINRELNGFLPDDRFSPNDAPLDSDERLIHEK